MAALQGAAVYKKKEGLIVISDDHKSVTWTPAAPGVSDVNIKVADITSMKLFKKFCRDITG